MRAISQAAFLIGGINNEFYRERIFTGKAPTGRSAGSQPCERAFGSDTSAYPRGRYIRESYSAGTANVIETVGGLSMQSNQIIIINGTLRAIFFFYPEGRTYSPPIKWAVVLLKQTCALRGLRLRWSLAEAAAEPSPSVRLPVRQPHCQRCTAALTAWVSLRRHPISFL